MLCLNKGVPAALFMMASKIIIEDHAKIGKSPAQVLHDTNKALYAKGQSDMFVTIWIGVLEAGCTCFQKE